MNSYKKIYKSAKEWFFKTFESFAKWCIIALVIGTCVGFTASAFNFLLGKCAEIRENFPYIIIFLPIFGLMLIALYRLLKFKEDKGTNMVLISVRDGEEMTLRHTISIFFGSILTHLGGGSAGREGAALQIGGSIGSQVGIWLGLKEQDHRLITMCGMSAGFSALFGTPAAAAFFAMEVISVGIMHYSAIVPCVIAAITGFGISSIFGVSAENMTVILENITITVYLKTAVIAALCGILSSIFCYVLKNSARIYRYFIRNPYIRIFVGGTLVAALTFIIGSFDYNGAGAEIIARSFKEQAGFEVFVLKLLMTALTLGAGYKGGEIMPVFFVGSAFGSFIAPFLGLDCSLGAAIGLACLFCGVTNCPVTAVFLCMEMFGVKNLPVYILAIAVSYMLSGYAGLYSEQKIIYSKTEPKYIDKKVGKK